MVRLENGFLVKKIAFRVKFFLIFDLKVIDNEPLKHTGTGITKFAFSLNFSIFLGTPEKQKKCRFTFIRLMFGIYNFERERVDEEEEEVMFEN